MIRLNLLKTHLNKSLLINSSLKRNNNNINIKLMSTSTSTSLFSLTSFNSINSFNSLYDLLIPISITNPILPVLTLATLQAILGAFDNIYHHELTERLPWRKSQRNEQLTHAIRGALYTGAFASFAGITPHGYFSTGMISLLCIEFGITLWDFVTEDKTRLLPPTERVTHAIMTLNYGALLACWLPILYQSSYLPTELVFQNYGLFSIIHGAAIVGAGGWALRDWYSIKRLENFQKETLPKLNLNQPNQSVLVVGGTGLLGNYLVKCLLAEGHHVTLIARNPKKAIQLFTSDLNLNSKLTILQSLDNFYNPLDEKFDIIVNLAGEPIADSRWTSKRKETLSESRIQVTKKLMEFVNKLKYQPKVILSGSAIGYYGVNDGTLKSITEDNLPLESKTFSQQLVAEWENVAINIFQNNKNNDNANSNDKYIKYNNNSNNSDNSDSTRLILARTGVVLTRDGGMLSRLLTLFEFGLGGRTGSGKQMLSWIHIDDWIYGASKCINDNTITGPVNFTAPNPVTNEEFTKALGKTLNRPTFLPAPTPILKLILGSELVNELLLTGCGVVPDKLQKKNLKFAYPDIHSALDAICHGKSK